jgi:SH3 domain protein
MTVPTIRLLAIGLLLSLPLLAQAAFITDKIVVDVHAERFDQGAVLKKLSSGSSVEVLMSDGAYSRVRTNDNVTGWIKSEYLSNEKPTQLEYLELLARSKALEAKLKAAEDKLANTPAASAASINDEELAQLQQQAKDAKWMRVEMMKARDRAEQAEAKLKATDKKSNNSKQELVTLRSKNKDLEQRLAAALLVNQATQEEQQAEIGAAPLQAAEEDMANADVATTDEDDGWSVSIEWFLGSIVSALIVGLILGMTWLDKRIRQRHGGFRIY